MKTPLFTISLVVLLSVCLLDSCKPSTGGKTKGRQQPKTGKMPCPMKDC